MSVPESIGSPLEYPALGISTVTTRSLVITLSCAVEEITSFSFSTVIAILSPATILSTSVPALISVE